MVVDGLRFLLILFRVNERITDGNAQSGSYQFRQIDIQRMVGKRGIVKLLSSRRLLRQGDSKDTRRLFGILAKGFVEVAVAHQDHRIRMFLLQLLNLMIGLGLAV